MSVLAKLNDARIRFHSTEIKKSGHNKFAGYYYFELADFIVPALKICNDLKLSAVVSYGADLASMTLTDLEDGSTFVITSPMSSAALKGCHDVQNLGAVQTYLRRYLWVAALEIVEHDALDSTTGKGEKPRSPANKSVGAADFDSLSADRKSAILDHAAEIEDMFNDNSATPEMAYDLYRETMDNLPLTEEQAALRGKLNSHIKTAFTKIYNARNAATPQGGTA